MVEKIDFTKSGATNEARRYAETITLEMCKHTAKACGFVTTEDKRKWRTKYSGARSKRTSTSSSLPSASPPYRVSGAGSTRRSSPSLFRV